MLFTFSIIAIIITAISGQSTLTNPGVCTYSFVVPATERVCSTGEDKQELVMMKQKVQLLEEMLQRVNVTVQLVEERLKNQLNHMRQQALNLSATIHKTASAGGAVYVRWGRTICPETAVKVYDGVVGGSHYTHLGGGVEKLCLPMDPEWGKTTNGYQSGSYLYGAEYEISSNDPFSIENAESVSTLNQQDVVCAVCQTSARPSHLMIAAKKTCPESWTKEYDGYLMAGHYTYHRSSFACVDSAPEIREGGGSDNDGTLFYNVEAVCGSLPCSPYNSGWEVTCVVCTK